MSDSISLPVSIQNFFSGRNARDFDLAVSGFAQSAVVKDEAQDHTGTVAIRRWMEQTVAQYDDTAEVKSVASTGNAVEVVAELSGNFPGSPILLRFNFIMEDDRIVLLEIAP